MIEIKTETKFLISQLAEVIGVSEEEVINKSVMSFFKKHATSIMSLATVTGFGMFHHVFIMINL